MSHFSVLVIGDNIEDQLQPFHEFECTGEDDQYVIDVDITKEIQSRIANTGESLNDALDYYGLYDKIVQHSSEIDKTETHKYGYAMVNNAKLICAIKRTNPNEKWDWYVLGGRWTGMFKLKTNAKGLIGEAGLFTATVTDKTRADSAYKKDIDFEAMRNEEEEKARKEYQEFYDIIGSLDLPPKWNDFIKNYPDDIQQARDDYHSLPVMKKIAASKTHWWGDINEIFNCTENEYALAARNSALVTHAVLKDGQWYENGGMDWWGIVLNQKDNWNEEFTKLLDSIPDNTLLSVVDCHI